MRTQFHFVGLLGLVAGGLVGTAGCDDVTAGQSSDTAGPPQLAHVLLQDARYLFAWPNRASSLDILDNGLAGTGTACNDTPISPCINTFLVDQVAPDVSCTNGFCKDPLKIPSTNVPVPLSADLLTGADDNRDPGGGIQVRLVFTKVLDSSIETITPSGSMTPGATNKYALNAGIVELDDGAGMPVPSVYYLDNGGSPTFSSDLELVPLGPAIVIKPKQTLDAATTYTIKVLNPGVIKDREGNAAVMIDGSAIPASFKFKTEDLQPTSNTVAVFGSTAGFDFPDFSDPTAPPTITPNEVIQIGFWEATDETTATVTITGPAGINVIVFNNRGANPTMCGKAPGGGFPFILDVVNATSTDLTTATPVDWPAGDYTMTVTVKDINGLSTYTSPSMMFSVAGTDEPDPMTDPNIAAAHVTPAQCMM